MQFLKILFWCLLAFLAAAFTIGNWVAVPVRLPGGLVADVNLPFLLLTTFLAGLLPTLGWQTARRWRLRQRLTTCERALAETRAAQATVAPIAAALPPASAASAPLAVTPLSAPSAPSVTNL